MSAPDDPYAALKARCARAGVAIARHSTEGGLPWYTAEKWGRTRTFTDLAEVERWLKHLAGPSA